MLKDNAFFILDVTTRDDRETIAEAFDEKAAEGEYDETLLHHAQRKLMASKPRLEEELAWFPDIAPQKGRDISKILNTGLEKNTVEVIKKSLAELNDISTANVASYVCMEKKGDIEFIKAIIAAQAQISADTTQSLINSNRKIAGFPDIDETLVHQQLDKLRQMWAEAVMRQVFQFDHPGNFMVELINSVSNMGDHETKLFLDILMERYESFVVPKLRDYEDRINNSIIEIKNDNKQSIEERIEHLIQELELWDEYAQPSQLVYYERGLDEPRSKKIYNHVRDFSLWLANDANLYQQSLRLSKAAKDIFAELPFVSNRIEEDIIALESLVAESEMEKDAKPLVDLALKIFENDTNFVKLLQKNGFSDTSPGMVGEVFRAFYKFRIAAKDTVHASVPWEILRKIAIHVNNEAENPKAANVILSVMQGLSPPFEVREQIEDDILTMKENILGKNLGIALQGGNLSRAQELLRDLINYAKTEEDKNQWRLVLRTVEEKQQKKIIGWVIWIAIGCVILALSQCK